MKFTKKRGYDGSIRKVWSDDKSVLYGIVGTVGDLIKEGILELDTEEWMYIPADNTDTIVGPSLDSVLFQMWEEITS